MGRAVDAVSPAGDDRDIVLGQTGRQICRHLLAKACTTVAYLFPDYACERWIPVFRRGLG
jgi:hypothetical protein